MGALNRQADLVWTNVVNGIGQRINSNGNGPIVDVSKYAYLELLIIAAGGVTGTTPTLAPAIDGFDSFGNAFFIGGLASPLSNTVAAASIAVGPGTANGFVVPNLAQVTWQVGGTTPQFFNTMMSLIGRI
jgi:hypothetical protein